MRYGDYFMNHDIRILSLKDRYNGMSQRFWSLLSYEWGPLQIALERFQRVSMGWNKFQLLRVYVLSPHWNPSVFRGICRGYVFHQLITGSWAYLGWTSIFKNGGVRSMWDTCLLCVFFFCCALLGVNRKKSTIRHVEIIQTFIEDPCVSSVIHSPMRTPSRCWTAMSPWISSGPTDLLVVGVFLLSPQIFRGKLGEHLFGVCVCVKNRNGTIIILLPNSANGQNFWNFLGITYLMGKLDMATTLTQGFLECV